MKLNSHTYFPLLLLVLLCGCSTPESIQPNFLINGNDIVSASELVMVLDSTSQEPALARVKAGLEARLTNDSKPAGAEGDFRWTVNGKELEAGGTSRVGFIPEGSGLQAIQLCVGENNCIEKYIFVTPASNLPVTSLVAEPPAPSELDVLVQIPVEPKEQVVKSEGLAPLESTTVEYPQPKDSVKGPILPSKEPGESTGGASPPPPPPPPPEQPKPLSNSKTIGPKKEVFSEDCGKYAGTTKMIKLSPVQDIELRSLALNAEHCGMLMLTLTGGGIKVSEDYDLFGGSVSIPLNDFRDRLLAGTEYTLTFKTSSVKGSCAEGLAAPRLGEAKTCSKSKPESKELNTGGDTGIVYDLQFYY
jgi:hypothetical protein